MKIYSKRSNNQDKIGINQSISNSFKITGKVFVLLMLLFSMSNRFVSASEADFSVGQLTSNPIVVNSQQGKLMEKNTVNLITGESLTNLFMESKLAPIIGNYKVLPKTGESTPYLIFGGAALAILAAIGLIIPKKRKKD